MIVLLVFILAVMVGFPETSIAKILHCLLVASIVDRLAVIRPGHLVFGCAVAGAAALMFILFETDGVRLVGFMAPDVVAWFTIFDVSVFLDAIVFAFALAATTRLRAVRVQIGHRAQQMIAVTRFVRGRRCRASRARPTTPKPTRSDDPDPLGWAQALAPYRAFSIS